MQVTIDKAISLRELKAYDESRALLSTLLNDNDFQAKAHLHIAWSFDNEGKEDDAIFHYEAALKGGLTGVERFDTLFGLASTFRSLGRYQEALEYFELTILEFPDALECQPFYAMCLYNLGEHKKATALLLELLVNTTSSEAITEYQRAIRLYASDLDKKW